MEGAMVLSLFSQYFTMHEIEKGDEQIRMKLRTHFPRAFAFHTTMIPHLHDDHRILRPRDELRRLLSHLMTVFRQQSFLT